MSWQQQIVGVLAIALGSLLGHQVAAQDFRVDSDVYMNGEKEPFSQHLTLFVGSLVYDFTLTDPDESLIAPKEIVILDNKNGKIILLDVPRRRRAEITTAKLLELTARIRIEAAKDATDDLLFLDSTMVFEKDRQTVELQSQRITYRATGIEPKQPHAVIRYQDFADWYCRLNAMRPGNIPPFGRLKLNRALAAKGLLPEQVERTVRYGGAFGDKHLARSQHLIHWQLSNTDRQRINKAKGHQLAVFTKISLREYLQFDRVARR